MILINKIQFKNKVLFLYLIFSFLLVQISVAQTNYSASAIPTDLKKGAVAVVRSDYQKFTILNKGEGKLLKKYAITIINEKGKNYGQLRIGYRGVKAVKKISGRLFDAEGREIRQLKKSDINDVSAVSSGTIYEDSRIKYAELKHYKYPYTVEFSYEIEINGLMFYPSWYPQLSRKLSVEKSSYEVTIPKNLNLRFKNINLDIEPKVTKEGENNIYKWEQKNIKPFKVEEFSPIRTLPQVLIAPSIFEVSGYEGDMTSWKNLGKFQNQLNEGRNDLSENTIQEIKSLVANAKNDEEKVRIVYQYLQENTRYVSIQLGIGGWQPFKASFVDKNKYGDCKALSFYTKSLLEAVGINANYVIVGAGDDIPPMLKDFSSQNQFNHVILNVPLKQDTIWLECTSQTEAFGYLSSFTSNRNVLMVTPEGGKVVKTPAYTKKQNRQKRIVNVTIDEEGNAEIKISATYSALSEGVRARLAEASREDQKEWLYKNLGFSNFEILQWELKREKNRIPVTKETINLKIKKYASLSNNRIFFNPNLLTRWSYIPDKNENRKFDIELPAELDFLEEDEIIWNLPKGYRPEAMTEKTSLNSEFGDYETSLEINNQNQLVYKRKFSSNAGKYKAEEYSNLRDYWKSVRKSDKNEVVFLNKS